MGLISRVSSRTYRKKEHHADFRQRRSHRGSASHPTNHRRSTSSYDRRSRQNVRQRYHLGQRRCHFGRFWYSSRKHHPNCCSSLGRWPKEEEEGLHHPKKDQAQEDQSQVGHFETLQS